MNKQEAIAAMQKIKSHNTEQFIKDFRRVRNILCHTDRTQALFKVSKKQVWTMAATCEIHYYITDNVFTIKRDVMVIG